MLAHITLTLSEEEQIVVLNQALEQLRLAVDAGRAYLFENFVDPELGLCTGMQAEVCAPGVHRQIGSPANQRWPWLNLPKNMRQALEACYSGPYRSHAGQLGRITRSYSGPTIYIAQLGLCIISCLRNGY